MSISAMKWKCRGGGDRVIRQAVSCDVCGAEMQGANHWFVAVEQGGELRVSGWNPRGRPRADAKHLCGQTCLYKLVDEYIVHTGSVRGPSNERSTRSAAARSATVKPANKQIARPSPAVVASMPEPHLVSPPQPACSEPAYIDEYESSARVIPTPEPLGNSGVPAASQDAAGFAARNWRAEAWKREREREQNQNEHRSKPLSRRRTFA